MYTAETLNPMQAYYKVMAFAQQVEPDTLHLAMHAAVARGLYAELVHLLRINFLPMSSHLAEADLLLSDICHDRGGDYYEFDEQVRRILLQSLVQTYQDDVHPELGSRLRRVARFLAQYVEHKEHELQGKHDRVLGDYLNTQRWIALAFLDQNEAARQLAQAVRDSVAGNQAVARLRIGGLASALSLPLMAYDDLLTYIQAMDEHTRGNQERAQMLFRNLPPQPLQFGDVQLVPPSQYTFIPLPPQQSNGQQAQQSNGVDESPPVSPDHVPDKSGTSSPILTRYSVIYTDSETDLIERMTPILDTNGIYYTLYDARELVNTSEYQTFLQETMPVVLVLSSGAKASRSFEYLLNAVLDNKRLIIPILAEGTIEAAVPESLQNYQFADLRGDQFEAGMQQVIQRLIEDPLLVFPTVDYPFITKNHIFLAYSRTDNEMMRRVRDDLEKARIKVWTDEHIEVGTPNWQSSLEKAIEDADGMVCLLSPEAAKSQWIREELYFALERKINIFLLMIRGDATTSLPLGFSLPQWQDIRTEALYQQNMPQFIETLRQFIIGEQQTSPVPQIGELHLYLSPHELDEVIGLLLPFVSTEPERKALLVLAFSGSDILGTIDYSGSAEVFTIQALIRILEYGEVELAKPALFTLLGQLRKQVGNETQEQIDDLIARIVATMALPKDDLAAKFREAQSKIHLLWRQYQADILNQAEYERQLPQLSLLDNEQNWWTWQPDGQVWYRFNNSKNEWELTLPPVPINGDATPEGDLVNPPPIPDLPTRFQHTYYEAARLRNLYQQGQLTREELETQLRELMVLDDNDIWWMVGVDTLMWYRFDNQTQEWIQDTPPVVLEYTSAQPSGDNTQPETSPETPIEQETGKAVQSIFISYSREDIDTVLVIQDYLDDAGFTVLTDNIALQKGITDFQRTTRTAIEKADVVLYIGSPAASRSNYVHEETALAGLYNKPIYPLWIAGENWYESAPLQLSNIAYIDMRGDAYETGMRQLIQALKGEIPAAQTTQFQQTTEPTPPPVRQPPYVFVAHAPEDAAFVRQLRENIGDEFTLWTTDDIPTGRDRRIEIDRAIFLSDVMLVVITEASMQSVEVTYQWSLAMGRGMRLLPLLLERVENMHPKLVVIRWVDFTQFRYDWNELTNYINKVRDGRTASTQYPQWQTATNLNTWNHLWDETPITVSGGQVFISYSRHDNQFTNFVIKQLENQFAVWTDMDIRGGEDWREALDEAIQNSFAVIVMVSAQAMQSRYVTYEWAYALGLGKPVIPVIAEHVSQKPLWLQQSRNIDLSTPSEAAFETLRNVLGNFRQRLTHTTTPDSKGVQQTDEAQGSITVTVDNLRVRSGAGVKHPPIGQLRQGDTAQILGSAPDDEKSDVRWFKIAYQDGEGWVHENFVQLTDTFRTIDSSLDDKYTNPVQDAVLRRDYNSSTTGNPNETHWGWDIGTTLSNPNPPIFASAEGLVVTAAFCQQCGTEGASVTEKGFSVADTRVLNDAGWNFGYGHYVIVRYHNDTLPESTRKELAQQGFEGGHCFVMYAHLKQILVKTGEIVQREQQIGLLGNSGNAVSPHLHLELRVDKNPNNRNWAAMRSGLMPPQVLFLQGRVHQDSVETTATSPADDTTLRLLETGRRQAAQSNYQDALKTFEQALQSAEDSLKDDIYYEMAKVAAELRDFEQQANYLRHALELNPNHVQSLVALGTAYRRQADQTQDIAESQRLLDAAKSSLQKALKIQPDMLDDDGESVWGRLGGIYRREGQVSAAIRAYERAAQVKQSIYPYSHLGLLYIMLGDFAKSKQAFSMVESFAQSTLTTNPADAWAYSDLLHSQIMQEKLDAAEETLSKLEMIADPYVKETLLRNLRDWRQRTGFTEAQVAFIEKAIAALETDLPE